MKTPSSIKGQMRVKRVHCLCVCVCEPCVCASVPQFLSEVEAWCKVCSEGGLPSEMQELELAIHRHQSLYEQVTQAYTEVRRSYQHSSHHTHTHG